MFRIGCDLQCFYCVSLLVSEQWIIGVVSESQAVLKGKTVYPILVPLKGIYNAKFILHGVWTCVFAVCVNNPPYNEKNPHTPLF